MLPRLSAPVSGVDCPCPFFHANSLLLASLLSSRQLPSAGLRRQLPSSGSPVNCLCPWFHANSLLSSCPAIQSPTAFCRVASSTALLRVASSTPIRVPLPLPDTARFQVQESFVWFRAKTDKGIICFGSLPT